MEKNNQKPSKKIKKKKSKKKIIKRIILIIFLICILLGLIGVGAFMAIFFSDKFAMSKEDLTINYTNTFVYDSEGNLIKELTGEENRKIISLKEMPTNLPNAFVAIEDERFYEHHGIDIKRTVAATVTYLTNKGSSSFGGSSITQQLIKNITNEKDDEGTAGIERKIKEMSRAYQIEKILSKDDILELYLNIIYLGGYGKNICGVEVASEYYFGKSAKDLTLAECAFLAGINHSPNNYNPFIETDNSQKIKNRTETVLEKMKELNFINEEEYNTSIQEVESGLPFQEGNTSSGAIVSYHISSAIEQVVNQLVDEKGMSYEYAKSRLYGGGYKLYTSQVSSIQSRMEEEYKKDKYIVDGKTTENLGSHSQSAMVIIDYKTGSVVGCVGGLGTDVNAIGINRINSPRQPGSSIKPLASISPGLESNIIVASTVYDDSPTTFSGYRPVNSTGYQGLCTVRKAIEVSANVVEVKIMSELGPENSIKFLKQMGLDHIDETQDANLAAVLGGLTYGATPLEMAGAYSMIANNGEYITPTFYKELKDKNDNIVLTPKQERRRVISEGNSYIVKSILTGPVSGSQGTATGCKIPGMEVGAKTGTTDNNNDRWLCGITPYYVGATWYGFDKQESIPYSLSNPSATIWAAIMKDIHKDLPSKNFDKPENIVTARVCKNSGKSATSSCTSTYIEEFVAGTVPEACTGHQHIKICKETGKLATEYCKDVEERTVLKQPDKEKDASWKTSAGGKYSTITETCNVHTKPEQTPNEENNGNNEKNENKQQESKDDNVKVPTVEGLTESAAKELLSYYSLKCIVKYKEEDGTEGIVIKQSRNSGVIVPKNTEIEITVRKKKTVNKENEQNKQTENKTTENKEAENKTTENKGTENKTTENNGVQNKEAESKTT